MFEFKLPDVGEGMHEAEMLRWLVGPGETVKVDQPMLEIQTDKAVVEIPAPVAGTVGQILAPVGHIARVGEVLITFETAAKSATPVSANMAAVSSNQATPAIVGAGGVIARKPGAVRAAPAVRKRAVELDVDITQVAPSSPDGRVLLKDVEDYAANRAKQPATATAAVLNGNGNGHAGQNGNGHTAATVEVARATEPAAPAKNSSPAVVAPRFEGGESEERRTLAGLRRRIAERMEQSWRTIPHAAAFGEADVTNLVSLRGQLQETAQQRGVKMTYLPLIVKAVGRVLKQYPIFNASLDEQTREVIYKGYYHIGLATATPEGLVVPVVRHADKLTLLALAAEINRLSEGGRQRSLKPAELSGSTFTVSNVGSYGGSYGVAVINPPEAAILAVGKATEQAVIRAGQIVARQIMPLSLSFDHRLIDGAEAGAFLNALTALLENPSLLLLDAV